MGVTITATKANRYSVEPATRTPTLEPDARTAGMCKASIAALASESVHRLDVVTVRMISRTARRPSLELVLPRHALQEKAPNPQTRKASIAAFPSLRKSSRSNAPRKAPAIWRQKLPHTAHLPSPPPQKEMAKKKAKTYNSGDSLLVTHEATNPPFTGLSTAEQTGSAIYLVPVVVCGRMGQKCDI